MKKYCLIPTFVILALLTNGCKEYRQNVQREKTKEKIVISQRNADQVVGDIQYIKDPRTGLCFAYYWGGAGNGGPALATVPCEAIPPELITVAQVKPLSPKQN